MNRDKLIAELTRGMTPKQVSRVFGVPMPKVPKPVKVVALREIKPKFVRAKKTSTANQRRKQRELDAGGTFTKDDWQEIIEMYGHRCLRCGEVSVIVPDHIQALYCGGRHEKENIQPLCYKCNLWKGIRTIDFRS